MRRSFATLGVLVSAVSAQAATPVETILTKTLSGYVRPAYTELKTVSETLVSAAGTLCKNPSIETKSAAQAAFKDTVAAWSKVEWFRTGAVMNDNRIERMYYFPDRKGVGLKQVQAALAAKDESAASAANLITKSVAMQGLGASEFLLFGTGSEILADKTLANADGAYRCAYTFASANIISQIARELETGWTDISESTSFWQKPAGNNPYFRSDAEALNIMIGTLIHGLEAVKDLRLAAFLGDTADADKPKMAAYWRSDTTFASIAANLEGLQNFYDGSDIKAVLPNGNDGLLRTIKFDFDQGIKAAKSLDGPLDKVLSNADTRKKAAYVQLTVQILIDHFNTEFATAAGLAAGFSFADGD